MMNEIDEIEKEELKTVLINLFNILNPRETEIIKLCYGIDSKKLSLRKIGKLFGISGTRVAQIRNRILRKLRKDTKKSGLYDFYFKN